MPTFASIARRLRSRPSGSAEILLATPRIQKPDEFGIFLALAKHGASGFLVRNLAGVAFCAERSIPFVCDFSLNAANELTVDYLRSLGAQRVTVSYDLNRDQLLDLVDAVPPEWLEVVIHQHMPMFHMEHCVFCAVLSPGTNKHNCGRPCDVHAVKLRDRVGMEHPLTADVGCRNTLFNAVAQSAAEKYSFKRSMIGSMNWKLFKSPAQKPITGLVAKFVERLLLLVLLFPSCCFSPAFTLINLILCYELDTK